MDLFKIRKYFKGIIPQEFMSHSTE